MLEPEVFQQSFGAALAGHDTPWLDDPAIARALTVHRNTSIKAALDALAANYPVILALVGDDAFTLCASDFVDACAPDDPRLCLYGARFDTFLATYAPFADVSYLSDIATLERLVTEALFAADAPAFDGNDLEFDQPLLVHPASRFASFASPAAAIWAAHQPDAEPDALDKVVWAPCDVIVTRTACGILVSTLEAQATVFMERCFAGASLFDAAAAVSEGEISSIFAKMLIIGALRAPDPKELLHAQRDNRPFALAL